MIQPPFIVKKPPLTQFDNNFAVVLDPPHSGVILPADFNSCVAADQLLQSRDHDVDELFSAAPAVGAGLLCATVSRLYIDLNRFEHDIDPILLGQPQEGREQDNDCRWPAGHGLVRRLLKNDLPLYNHCLSEADINHRLDTVYTPYHTELKNLIDEAHSHNGLVYHLNCHSMPSAVAYPRQPSALAMKKGGQVDFTLSDRNGTTCSPQLIKLVRDYLAALGYTVSINDPYRGMKCIEAYSAPFLGRHSLQIEINKKLYWDEVTHKRSDDFDKIKQQMTNLIEILVQDAASKTGY